MRSFLSALTDVELTAMRIGDGDDEIAGFLDREEKKTDEIVSMHMNLLIKDCLAPPFG